MGSLIALYVYVHIMIFINTTAGPTAMTTFISYEISVLSLTYQFNKIAEIVGITIISKEVITKSLKVL